MSRNAKRWMGAVGGFTLDRFSMSISGVCGSHNNSMVARAGKGIVEHFPGRRWVQQEV